MQSSRAFVKSYQYVMEVILLYILLLLFYIQTDHLPPILPFIVITGGGAVLIAFLLSIMKKNTNYFFIIVVIPLLALLGSEMGLGFGTSLFLATIVCYRTVVHAIKIPKITESIILNSSLLLGGLVYFAAKVQGVYSGAKVEGYSHSDIVLYLLITQLLFFMLGKVLTGAMTSSLIIKENELKKHSWSIIGLFSSMFAGAVVLAIVFPIVFVKVVSIASSLVGKGMYAASIPLFNAIDNWDRRPRAKGESVGSANWGGQKAESTNILESLGTFDIWLILSIIGIFILAFLVFLIARKRIVREPELVAEGYPYATTTEVFNQTNRKRKRARRETPQAKVRKLIFELEILSASKGLGRHHYESITEWLNRNQFLDNRLVELYERVRYGDEELTDAENQACEEIVKQVKGKIKSLKSNKNK